MPLTYANAIEWTDQENFPEYTHTYTYTHPHSHMHTRTHAHTHTPPHPTHTGGSIDILRTLQCRAYGIYGGSAPKEQEHDEGSFG